MAFISGNSDDWTCNQWKKFRSGTTRLLLYLCPIVIFILFILTKGTNDRITHGLHLKKSFEDCSWQFHDYIPSAWEMYWLSNIKTFQYEVCSILARTDQINKTIDVLLRIISLQKSLFDIENKTLPIDIHFSKMHYQQNCTGKISNAIQLIEPLIGLIRDPLTMCPHLSSVAADLYLEGEFALQSKRFLLLAPSSPFQIDRNFPSPIPSLPPWLYLSGSQKILIDIGSSYFKSRNGNTAEIGAKWFYDYFHEKSIRFDRIIAYEYQNLIPRRVWEELPDDVLPFYTFINVGVEETIGGKFHPWTMLQSLAKPTDYVVLKLDIDKPPLESALMKQLFEETNSVRYLIDELFFEKHVSDKKESNEEKLQHTYELFIKLRQCGIRMHGWP